MDAKPKKRGPTGALRWSVDKPRDGWWFMRWRSEPERWFIVEVFGGAVMAKGLLPGDVETAQLNGGEWAGPIKPPETLRAKLGKGKSEQR